MDRRVWHKLNHIGSWGRCQVSMALIGGAWNVIQWFLQKEAKVQAGAKPKKKS